MTQRKRATGFALMDTAFAADAKFVRLARKAPNEVAFAACVGVYWLILADARRARSAVINWEDYTEYTEQIAALKEAKLLTVNGFEDGTFDNWAPAYKTPNERTRPSPAVPNRTGEMGESEHGAYPTVPDGIGGTPTSPHLTSNQVEPIKETRAQTNGTNGSFMGYRPKVSASSTDIAQQERQAWTECATCGVIGRKHSASGDHQFSPKLRSVS